MVHGILFHLNDWLNNAQTWPSSSTSILGSCRCLKMD